MIDNTKSLETDPSAMYIAVILNADSKTIDHIDSSFQAIQSRLGVPHDLFRHFQSVGQEEYLCVISSGMKMPTNEIMDVYNRYRDQTNLIDKSRDNFFSMMEDLEDDPTDKMFEDDLDDDEIDYKKSENEFFKKHNGKKQQKQSSQKSNDGSMKINNMKEVSMATRPEFQDDSGIALGINSKY
jgi:hypothetical protein